MRTGLLPSCCSLAPAAARAEGERAGDFDYYVLALSWSPNWCALEGDARGRRAMRPGADFGWILHGLWPQYEDGWPSFCPTAARAPSRAMTGGAGRSVRRRRGGLVPVEEARGLFGAVGAGLLPAARARPMARVNRPEVLRKLDQPVTLPASVIEEAFLQANPGWSADMVTITCKDGHIQEARICLTRDLEPRDLRRRRGARLRHDKRTPRTDPVRRVGSRFVNGNGWPQS